MIYLDTNATAPPRPEAYAAMQEAWALPLNASSVHAMGRKARQWLEEARQAVAQAVGAWPNEVIFTASGTEANNMALRAMERPLLVGATEHPSVLALARRLGGDVLPVDADGLIDPDILESKLKALGRPALVSIMLANNETGVIQPLRALSAIVHAHDGLLHSDAVQAWGKIPVDMGLLGADMLTLCAHKSGGPVGIGALLVRNDLAVKPFLIGGGQELNRRAGTQAVALARGFAATAEASRDWIPPVEGAMASLRARIEGVGGRIAGSGAERLPQTLNILMPGVASETQLMHFDLESFCVSAGSACSSGRIEPSPVLRAMGYHETDAATAIRISAGWSNKPEDLAAFGACWEQLFKRLGKQAA